MSAENTKVTCSFPEWLEDLYLQEEATAQPCQHKGSCINESQKGDKLYSNTTENYFYPP